MVLSVVTNFESMRSSFLSIIETLCLTIIETLCLTILSTIRYQLSEDARLVS